MDGHYPRSEPLVWTDGARAIPRSRPAEECPPFANSKLLSVPSAGGPTTLVMQWGTQHAFRNVRIASDSGRVVTEVLTSSPSGIELYFARIDGRGAPLRLNDPLPVGGTVVASAVLTEDTVLYRASQVTNGVFELFKSSLVWPLWRHGRLR